MTTRCRRGRRAGHGRRRRPPRCCVCRASHVRDSLRITNSTAVGNASRRDATDRAICALFGAASVLDGRGGAGASGFGSRAPAAGDCGSAEDACKQSPLAGHWTVHEAQVGQHVMRRRRTGRSVRRAVSSLLPCGRDYCRRRLASDLVDDAVAETFLTAWRRLADVPVGEQALVWLYGVAYRMIGHQWRSTARRRRLETRLRSVVAHSATAADE